MRQCGAMMNKDTAIGIKTLSGGVTAAEGFVAGGVVCGVRNSGRRDLGLLFSEHECTSAAVFTRNTVKGAPLLVTKNAVEVGDVRAVAAEAMGIEAREVAVASTGVIGEHLPMAKISTGIEGAAAGLGRDGAGFAEAILTTDTRTKEAAVQVEVGGKTVTVGGTAKGSGMIHPNMGTMLAFLTSDAAVEKKCLQETLSAATDRTFNRVTVDGDTSPSDMAVLLANGAAGNEALTMDSPDYPAFAEAVEDVARSLAKEIARDGEGATRLVEVVVAGAVVASNLVKAGVFGEDANWGRVLTAMGYSGASFDPDGVELWFGPVKVFENGEPVPHEEAEANAALAAEEVRITARLSEGDASAAAWGCDLTYDYVRINGSYRT